MNFSDLSSGFAHELRQHQKTGGTNHHSIRLVGPCLANHPQKTGTWIANPRLASLGSLPAGMEVGGYMKLEEFLRFMIAKVITGDGAEVHLYITESHRVCIHTMICMIYVYIYIYFRIDNTHLLYMYTIT